MSEYIHKEQDKAREDQDRWAKPKAPAQPDLPQSSPLDDQQVSAGAMQAEMAISSEQSYRVKGGKMEAISQIFPDSEQVLKKAYTWQNGQEIIRVNRQEERFISIKKQRFNQVATLEPLPYYYLIAIEKNELLLQKQGMLPTERRYRVYSVSPSWLQIELPTGPASFQSAYLQRNESLSLWLDELRVESYKPETMARELYEAFTNHGSILAGTDEDQVFRLLEHLPYNSSEYWDVAHLYWQKYSPLRGKRGLLSELMYELTYAQLQKLPPSYPKLHEYKTENLATHLSEWAEDPQAYTVELLNRYVPLGWGMHLDAQVGATLGFLGGDVDGRLYVSRPKESVIAVQRHLKVSGGWETGLVISSSKKVRGAQTGTETGVSAEAKGQSVVTQTFAFPIWRDEAMLAALLSMTSTAAMNARDFVIYLLSKLMKLRMSPLEYLTEGKIEAGIFAGAAAVAQSGLRKGQPQPFTRYKPNEYTDERTGSKYYGFKGMISRLLETKLIAQLRTGANFGVEYFYQNRQGEPTISSEAEVMEAHVFAEVKNTIAFPVLGPLLRMLPTGAGVRYKYQIDLKKPSADWKLIASAFYTAQGDLDFYQGAASETEIVVKEGSQLSDLLETIQLGGGEKLFDMDLFIKLTRQVNIRRRMFFNPALGKAKHKMRTYQEMKWFLKKQEKLVGGLEFAGYLDLEFRMEGLAVEALERVLSESAERFRRHTHRDPLREVLQDLLQFFCSGELAPYLEPLVDFLFQEQVLAKAKLHMEENLSLSQGGKIAIGVKMRGQGSFKAGITQDYDVKKEIVSMMHSNERLKLLKEYFK